MNTRRLAVIVCFAGASLVVGACGSEPKGSVSQKELAAIRQSSHEVRPGMKRADVMARYKGANMVRLSSTQIGPATIEEWKAEAFCDSKGGRDLSVQFLYFRNDVLVDVSDSRLNFRDNQELIDKWSHQPAR